MCLPRASVIVIVKSRDDRGARFKHINVREEFTMVAWLPQQILLLLVLVTATVTGATNVSEEMVKWSIGSGRRGEKSSTDEQTRVSSRQKEQGSVTTTSSDFSQAMSTKVSSTNIRFDGFYPIDDEHKTSSDSKTVSGDGASPRKDGSAGYNIGLPGPQNNLKKHERLRNVVDENEPKISNEIPLESVLNKLERNEADITSPSGFPSTAKLEDSTISEHPWSVVLESVELEPISAIEPNPQLNIPFHDDGRITDIDEKNYANSPVTPVIETNVKLDSHSVNTIGHSASTRNSQDSSIDSPKFQLEPDQDQVTPVLSKSHLPVENRVKETNNIELLDLHSNEPSHTHLLHRYQDRWHHDNDEVTLSPTHSPRRYLRDVPDSACEKFEIGDAVKKEFYSPNYPHNYPPSKDCVAILDAGQGNLVKLDFRDRFDLESRHTDGECRFDYLEVRDGQYGYANLIGKYCDKKFPPEITSKSRYLWLRFHSDDTIEYKGFKAVWTTIPRPTYPGVPVEQEPCLKYVKKDVQMIISSEDSEDDRALAQKNSLPLDCLWVIIVDEKRKLQLTFDTFKLAKPNDCDANFFDVYENLTKIPSRLKNFCGSIAEPVVTSINTMYIRFYLEPKAINSSFQAAITVIRDKDGSCLPHEHDCDDATCIDASLRCNDRQNCRLGWDEDASTCPKSKGIALNSTRIVIILVILAMIMFGLCFVFFFNCVRKLIRDHHIIQEHIRQSRENRLDEIGRKSTPCPISASQTDIRQHGSESPSLEIDSSKELIPTTTLIAQEYTKELVLEMKYNTKDFNDIHQSNNVSNATQERLQETSEEPEMCDSSCQTRESLFDPRIPEPTILPSPAFSTFGYRSVVSGSQNGVGLGLRRSSRSQNNSSPKYSHGNTTRQGSEHCSSCSPATRGRDSSGVICPRHAPIPAPPGWSVHDPPYSEVIPTQNYPETDEYLTYQRYQSPKPEVDEKPYQSSLGIVRQKTIGSGERYGSFLYNSEHGSGHTASNTNTSSSQHSDTPKNSATADSRYRAEAVIEVDQKRPFSIQSTKSAPDVIATH